MHEGESALCLLTCAKPPPPGPFDKESPQAFQWKRLNLEGLFGSIRDGRPPSRSWAKIRLTFSFLKKSCGLVWISFPLSFISTLLFLTFLFPSVSAFLKNKERGEMDPLIGHLLCHVNRIKEAEAPSRAAQV